MSMSRALLAGQNLLDRQQRAFASQRLRGEEPDGEGPDPEAPPSLEESTLERPSSERRPSATSTSGGTDPEPTSGEESSTSGDVASVSSSSVTEVDLDDDDDDEEQQANATLVLESTPDTSRMTLAELEEERELARRRSSACVMFAVFILFRLWIEAIQQGDFGVLLLCLVGTSWTARWIRHNREREEELDRRIAHYLEQQQQGNDASPQLVDRNDLRMLSFQAQLALAIMESQRQMLQGGFGNPNENASAGVSDQAKSRWEHFSYNSKTASGKGTKSGKSKAGYGSLAQDDDEEDLKQPQKSLSDDHEEEPHCSICLCEYEDGQTLVKLPCSHVYHDECIGSWTSNHVKCPLCNFDLETEPSPDDSIV